MDTMTQLNKGIEDNELFAWLGKEIKLASACEADYAAQAKLLTDLAESASAAGLWVPVTAANLEVGKAYVIRRPGTTQCEVAKWIPGWHALHGWLEKGSTIEVWTTDHGLGTPGSRCIIKNLEDRIANTQDNRHLKHLYTTILLGEQCLEEAERLLK